MIGIDRGLFTFPYMHAVVDGRCRKVGTEWLLLCVLPPAALSATQQYILANAAVSRSFSAYFAALIGKDPGFFTFPYGEYSVDFLAAGLMVACCLLLMFTTAGGSLFNTIVTGDVQDACCCC
jgi:hypothetical protein